ncbi:wax ester/triacylglycerol synthase family O-acyltransferase [Mycobacterium sp. M1]|uniref:Diacylglycerol O-acyltransferase n=1 Tax=Mycolicibacter acidiphilus TaxID=2835306 RepID=A0ABS5RGM4_9MYCO|nr:wax ester/triacylglycerol synthase family O-acyltransferase [Mycolicibacter acidiphilus]MBS9533445.1 wax ester/triacylglycerol synthase family O-acyltransferase [Mycolicibacter acidiphilus]
MGELVDAAGLPTELGAVDYLMHRGEANPRTRSGIMGVELLDTTPDWERFRAVFENVSRRVLRLRQKVVVPTLPTAAPRWVVDPDFNLDFHVRRIRVPEPGGLREVLDLAEVNLQSPLDVSRPLWAATLVEGLAGGRAATMLHLSHAVTDGVGGAAMFGQIYDLERNPPARQLPPQPVPQDLSPGDLMRDGINHLPGALLGGTRDALIGVLGMATRTVRDPLSTVTGAIDYLRSGARVVSQAADPSPLLKRRSLSTRTEALDIRLADLHRAAKAGGGSINDAYLAAVSGALGRYHRALGVPIATVPMAVPVNLRAEADPAGGNRFTGVNLAAPVGVVDPVERIKRIRTQMTQRREEPAMDLIGSIAPVLTVFPTPVLEQLTGSVVGADVQASNVAFYPGETYIAGAKVLRHYGIGPLPGVAMMVVLISRGGECTITVRYDRAAVRDEKLFAECLVGAFDEVLALAGDPAPHCVPASFASARATAESDAQ